MSVDRPVENTGIPPDVYRSNLAFIARAQQLIATFADANEQAHRSRQHLTNELARTVQAGEEARRLLVEMMSFSQQQLETPQRNQLLPPPVPSNIEGRPWGAPNSAPSRIEEITLEDAANGTVQSIHRNQASQSGTVPTTSIHVVPQTTQPSVEHQTYHNTHQPTQHGYPPSRPHPQNYTQSRLNGSGSYNNHQPYQASTQTQFVQYMPSNMLQSSSTPGSQHYRPQVMREGISMHHNQNNTARQPLENQPLDRTPITRQLQQQANQIGATSFLNQAHNLSHPVSTTTGGAPNLGSVANAIQNREPTVPNGVARTNGPVQSTAVYASSTSIHARSALQTPAASSALAPSGTAKSTPPHPVPNAAAPGSSGQASHAPRARPDGVSSLPQLTDGQMHELRQTIEGWITASPPNSSLKLYDGAQVIKDPKEIVYVVIAQPGRLLKFSLEEFYQAIIKCAQPRGGITTIQKNDVLKTSGALSTISFNMTAPTVAQVPNHDFIDLTGNSLPAVPIGVPEPSSVINGTQIFTSPGQAKVPAPPLPTTVNTVLQSNGVVDYTATSQIYSALAHRSPAQANKKTMAKDILNALGKRPRESVEKSSQSFNYASKRHATQDRVETARVSEHLPVLPDTRATPPQSEPLAVGHNAVAGPSSLTSSVSYAKAVSPMRETIPVPSVSSDSSPEEPLFLPSPSSFGNDTEDALADVGNLDLNQENQENPTSGASSFRGKQRAYVLIPDPPPGTIRRRELEERAKRSLLPQRHAGPLSATGGHKRSKSASIPTMEEDEYDYSFDVQGNKLSDGPEKDLMEVACTRLQKVPCKWDRCGFVMNSVVGLLEHLKTQHKPPKFSKPFSCLWTQCGRRCVSGELHLEKHALDLIICPYLGCEEQFRSLGQLRRHVQASHEGDELKPSWKPMRPRIYAPVLPAPDTLPAYMVIARTVRRASISEDYHRNVLGPWVLKNIAGLEKRKPHKQRSSKSMRGSNRDGAPDEEATKKYAYLTDHPTRYSTYLSEPVDMKLDDLESEQVSQLATEGLVLFNDDSPSKSSASSPAKSPSPSYRVIRKQEDGDKCVNSDEDAVELMLTGHS